MKSRSGNPSSIASSLVIPAPVCFRTTSEIFFEICSSSHILYPSSACFISFVTVLPTSCSNEAAFTTLLSQSIFSLMIIATSFTATQCSINLSLAPLLSSISMQSLPSGKYSMVFPRSLGFISSLPFISFFNSFPSRNLSRNIANAETSLIGWLVTEMLKLLFA